MVTLKLKEFEEVQRAHGALATRALGVIQVPIAEIVGSVGRARYFPEGLRPGRGLTPSRVRRLVKAVKDGEIFPPVLLYRIGHEYFIADGHHRVAAARLAGQEDIDAEVVAFLPEAAQRPEDVVARERVHFEQLTGITTIVLHEVGQYPKLLRWIEDYNRQRGRGSLKSSAREWYARIYLRTVQDPVFRRISRFFQDRSPGDLFVYIGDHKWIMSKAAGRDVGIGAALASFEQRLKQGRGPGGFMRWLEGLISALPRSAKGSSRTSRERRATTAQGK